MIVPIGKWEANISGLVSLRERLQAASDCYVTVGVHEGAGVYPDGVSVVSVALFNEFGTQHIPERSFIRSAINDDINTINVWREEAIQHILVDGWTVAKGLTMMGFRIQQLVQNKIKRGVPPPNSARTAAAKLKRGVAPRTLIDTGLLLRSIQYRVHTGKNDTDSAGGSGE